MIPTLRLEGDRDLAQRLLQLGVQLRKELILEALKEAAEPMRAHMEELAPRAAEERHRPDRAEGHMADHIVISSARSVDGQPVPEGAAAVAIGPAQAYWWAIFSEVGTIHESAHPFVRPAFDADVEQALELIGGALWNALREALPNSFDSSISAGTGTL
jgi:HK97 gp10 family phage protein